MELTGQWADSLIELEKLFLLKVAVWAAISTLVGTTLLALAGRRADPPIVLTSLATTLTLLGMAELLTALAARSVIPMRDHAAAVSLDRALWFVGGALSAVAVSSLVAGLRAWTAPRDVATAREAGRDVAIALHAAALAVLSLQLTGSVVR